MDVVADTQPFERWKAAARFACGAVMAAILGTGFWLAIIEEGHGGHIVGRTWTSHDFPDGLGNAMGATTEPARRGLIATMVIALLVVLLFAAVERVLPGRGWFKGLSFSPVIFLLWGLVFCPLVDARQIQRASDGVFLYQPSGLFGTESSLKTIPSAIVASLVTAIAIARVLQLVRSAEWWEKNDNPLTFVVDPGGGALLELPEEGPDKRSERTG